MSDFDFEAFISGARLAEDTFSLYLVDNGRKIAHLQEQIDKAKNGGDEREASTGNTADLEAQVAAQQQVKGIGDQAEIQAHLRLHRASCL